MFVSRILPFTRRPRPTPGEDVKIEMSQVLNDLAIIAIDHPIVFARLARITHIVARSQPTQQQQG